MKNSYTMIGLISLALSGGSSAGIAKAFLPKSAGTNAVTISVPSGQVIEILGKAQGPGANSSFGIQIVDGIDTMTTGESSGKGAHLNGLVGGVFVGPCSVVFFGNPGSPGVLTYRLTPISYWANKSIESNEDRGIAKVEQATPGNIFVTK